MKFRSPQGLKFSPNPYNMDLVVFTLDEHKVFTFHCPLYEYCCCSRVRLCSEVCTIPSLT